ncbi:hypothetical protein K6L44_06455 [Gluconacetobacter entanii]|uniref:hypothetical protein n=1 Tax=Gluconacetobacter entanii TaxID=108528 RepID=UPI001C936A78|nr:hypothetical protein [Gluconacetobacter entanii]MBY4639642.1 hypothetical protein [Gluconacetobacter entanii]MCW4579663.1 hypothetical protein [Gluconacetobacter entanii]MCW4583068.1 hypothetical protein [Gluconacetobacter entanii]MCW4586427.1 hypothetical protein [Gluconacetobacter entanii]
MRLTTLSLFALLLPAAAVAETPTGREAVEICASYDPTSPSDFQKEFSYGDIVVPAGTVFDGPAHMFNGLKDPGDRQHLVTDPKDNSGKEWLSISDAEEKRRDEYLRMDHAVGHAHLAFIIDDPITLTKQHLCGKVNARVIVSSQWDWHTRTINAAPDLYYQAYGVVSGDKIDTSFDNEEMPFQWNAQAGTINAAVIRTLDVVYELPPDSN